MKYAVHFLAFALIGWPSLIAGYLWAAIVSGWSTGRFMYARHEDAAIEKWLPTSAAVTDLLEDLGHSGVKRGGNAS